MTLTYAAPDAVATQPVFVPGAAAVVGRKRIGTAPTESKQGRLSAKLAERAANSHAPTQDVAARTALLGYLLGQLNRVDRSLACDLLGVSEKKLPALVHGEASLAATFEHRWKELADVLTAVRGALEDEYLQAWLVHPAPELGGKTPYKCLTGNAVERAAIKQLAERLSDPRFS